MDLSNLNIRTTIGIDFGICPRLVELYADSTNCMFVGEADGPYDLAKAEEMLKKYASTKMYGSHERYGFMKIFYGTVLVGFSIPRAITPKEYRAMKLEEGIEYHRIGTVYIDPKYRGKGIMTAAIAEFRKTYPNIVWACNSLNAASKAAALSAGLKFSHHLYVGKTMEEWQFEPFEGQVKTVNIYSIKQEVLENA